MISDQNLLEDFARSGSETAFRALVDRHLDLVHSVARRVTLNDDLARDVAQAVFVKLATRPDSVPKGIKLLAWLHRTTRHKAIDLVRSENRRRRREQIAITRQQDEMETSTDEFDWKELEPVIDEALAKLPATDRSLVLARYYQKRSHAATAEHLGITEDAARMRTKRALGKLRKVLSKQGIATGSALLATAVAANAVSPAPAALSAAVCKSGLAAAATSTASAGVTATTLAMLKANLAALAAVAIGVPVVALQYSENRRLENDIKGMQGEIDSHREPVAERTNKLTGLPINPRTAGKSLSDILADPDPLARMRDLLDYVDSVGTDSVPPVLVALRENSPGWDPDARIAARMLLARWGRDDPEAAFDYVEGLDYRQGAGDSFVVLGALAAADPQRAVAWLEDPANRLTNLPGLSPKLAGTIAREWVRQDPNAAIAWAKNAPKGQRMGALTGVIGTLTSDPQSATALAMEIAPSSERSEVIGQIAESWARRSPEQALEWAKTLNGGERQRGINSVLEGWSWTAPAQAAAYVDAMPAGERRASFVQTITESWARQDPAQAAAWVASQDESDAKTYAMGHVMWNWTVADPQMASTWLLEQPAGAGRDNAIDGLAKATFPENPSGAASWAAAIDHLGNRQRALDRTVRGWLAKEPAAAREWLSTSGTLSAEEATRYLSEIPSEK